MSKFFWPLLSVLWNFTYNSANTFLRVQLTESVWYSKVLYTHILRLSLLIISLQLTESEWYSVYSFLPVSDFLHAWLDIVVLIFLLSLKKIKKIYTFVYSSSFLLFLLSYSTSFYCILNGHKSTAKCKRISSFFYKFVFYTFVFYTFVFYNSKFICSLFIWFTFYMFVFYTFVFYTVRFLYGSLFIIQIF